MKNTLSTEEIHTLAQVALGAEKADLAVVNGDLVNVYNDRGNFKVKVILTEAIKPGVLSLCEGWWPEHFVEGHFSDITHMTINPVQEAIPPMHETNYAFNDNLVEVKKEKWD